MLSVPPLPHKTPTDCLACAGLVAEWRHGVLGEGMASLGFVGRAQPEERRRHKRVHEHHQGKPSAARVRSARLASGIQVKACVLSDVTTVVGLGSGNGYHGRYLNGR